MGRRIYTVIVGAELNDGLINVPLDSIIRFVLPVHSPLAVRHPRLLTTYPHRHTFTEVETKPYTGKSDWTAEIHVSHAGAYEFYFEYDDDNDADERRKSPIGNFIVEPCLQVAGKKMSIGEICMITLISRCMGPLSQWPQHFKAVADLGFNAIHFTPVQELGWSGSSYSIADHHNISSLYFPSSSKLSAAERTAMLENTLRTMEHEYGLIGITDVVWNHAASNSPWLHEHPEATYNIDNCPYLKPAFLVDRELMKLSEDLMNGVYLNSHGVGKYIRNEDDLSKVMHLVRHEVLQKLRLWEFFVIDVAPTVKEFAENLKSAQYSPPSGPTVLYHGNELEVLRKEGVYRDPSWERFCVRVNPKWALKLYGPVRSRGVVDSKRMNDAINEFKEALNKINFTFYKKYDDIIDAIMKNVAERIRYDKLAPHGPKHQEITKEHPLVEPYFSPIKNPQGEIITWCVNNGWIWGGNPLKNFAENPYSYLRRDVIIWSDSVKLRYGKRPEDSPFLWQYMKEYTQSMAKLFHGFRIDNCHSTPLSVARYLIDAAREVRPNIYIFAELFTGSEKYDNLFIAKLGINSLIREAMQAPDPYELGRLCHRYGGSPIGSITPYYPPAYYQKDERADIVLKGESFVPPALFFDCTHDNEVPNMKRTVEDSLSNATLVWSISAPVGTTMGYDLFLADRVSVADSRLYPILNTMDIKTNGMLYSRKVLNELHQRLEREGFTQIHIHQEGNLITVQRHNPRTHDAVYFIAHTAFSKDYNTLTPPTVRIPGKINGQILCGRVKRRKESDTASVKHNSADNIIHGMPDVEVELFGSFEKLAETKVKNNIVEIHWKNFPPGSVLILDVSLPDESQAAIAKLSQLESDNSLITTHYKGLTITDFNALLYRCEAEELLVSKGQRGTYNIPNYGVLPYAGLQGFVSVLDKIRVNNDMGHPMFNNLREGDWMIDYVMSRLIDEPRLEAVLNWMTDYFVQLKRMPRYLIPTYFDKIIMKLYLSAREYILTKLMPSLNGSRDDPFVADLAMTAVQFMAKLPGHYLISPSLTTKNLGYDTTMAAGLPHFSTGFMRAWGRDTFISLPGLLLITNRFQEARELILGFAASCRHGLIPNLLDSGINPRYNCRDAVWWWLYAIQEYCRRAPEGYALLSAPVVRLFPTDDYIHPSNKVDHKTTTLVELIQEVLQRHAEGIHFRERNAGHEIDAHMQDKGFNIDIYLDPETGFVFGGNDRNAGTWMDKMGESTWANNRGIPPTPRDGAAVEIIGMLKATLRWLAELSSSKKYPYSGVRLPDGKELTWKEWNDKIQANFEKYFYVPRPTDVSPSEPNYFVIDKHVVHKRGIYKDTYGSTHVWTDYQLRPNFLITMTIAPELFSPDRARTALDMVKKYLVGPLGMRTLDPGDKQYRPYYDAGRDSDDYFTAKGFNYHQGPEWVWPFGFYIRALIRFYKDVMNPLTLANMIHGLLRHHREAIRSSDWRGLPELTNLNGAPCWSSCPTQAWSSASILHAIDEVNRMT